MLQEFTFATLGEMDSGKLAAAFAQAFEQIRRDCADRPTLRDARTLTIKLKIKPVPEDAASGGTFESLDVQTSFDVAMPKKQSKVYNLANLGGKVVYNELSPDDARQATLDMALKPQPVQEKKTDVG